MNLENFKNWLILNQDSPRTIEIYFTYIKNFFKKYPEFNQENINKFLLDLISTKQPLQ